MGWFAWIIVGAIAGFLANLVTGSRENLLWMIVLGIVGGLVGGWVATNILKVGSVDGINPESIGIATMARSTVCSPGYPSRPKFAISRSAMSRRRSLKVGTTTLSSGAGRVAERGAGASAGETVLIAAVIGEGACQCKWPLGGPASRMP